MKLVTQKDQWLLMCIRINGHEDYLPQTSGKGSSHHPFTACYITNIPFYGMFIIPIYIMKLPLQQWDHNPNKCIDIDSTLFHIGNCSCPNLLPSTFKSVCDRYLFFPSWIVVRYVSMLNQIPRKVEYYNIWHSFCRTIMVS